MSILSGDNALKFTVRTIKGLTILVRYCDTATVFGCKTKEDLEKLIISDSSRYVLLPPKPTSKDLEPYKDILALVIRKEYFPEEVLITDMNQLTQFLEEGLILDSRVKTELTAKLTNTTGFHKQDLMKVLGEMSIGEIITGVDSFKAIDSSEVKDKLKNLQYVENVDDLLEFIGGVKLKYLLKDMAIDSKKV